jgi:hypothetical protein
MIERVLMEYNDQILDYEYEEEMRDYSVGKNTPFVNWLRREIRNGNTPIVVFCGRQRSGKTATAMRFAHEIYPDKFTFDNVTSDVERFAEMYEKFDHNIIILDEASDSLYVYDWNSLFQKVFSTINDTQAYKQNIVFLILPMVHKLGKIHRYDVDAIIMTRKMRNYTTKQPEIFYKYQIHMKNYNDLTMRPPRVMTILDWCGPVPLPPEHLWKTYLTEGQKQFKDKIMQKNLQAMMKKRGQKIQPARIHLDLKQENRTPLRLPIQQQL